ncbi:MAG: sulfotransferase [Rhodanobacteraceae bacterium]
MARVPEKASRAPSTTAAVEALLARGDLAAARHELDAIAVSVGPQAALAHDVAQLYMRLSEPERAADFYARAVALEPAHVAYRYNQSTALIALGRMEEAEAALDSVIADQSRDYDAWYNRATLRRQIPGRNHVAEIERALRRPELQRQEQVPLYYALARELEDLGEYERSFGALSHGAAARRSMLSYRVEDDEAIMRDIGAVCTRSMIREKVTGCDDSRPVFVVGLPRSGTTLVDRILSSHSRIGSHGESTDFATTLMKLVGPCKSKSELLEKSIHVDPLRHGSAYCARLSAHFAARVVDKTPANFLYLGLIARALTNARIVYVRRQPMDVCYAMYKTLFRMAYPYSYDLADLGRYWLSFDRLMRHWQDNLPSGLMLTIDYEHLVAAPEETTQALLKHVGMPWEPACLHFDKNPLPSLTASAAQVRQPIYRSSVGLWRRHASGLEPLAAFLRAAGVAIDSGAPA